MISQTCKQVMLCVTTGVMIVSNPLNASEPYLVKDINPDPAGWTNPSWLTTVAGMLMFSANDDVHGPELWRSDGTEAGTFMIKDINPVYGSTPSWLSAQGNVLFFSAFDASGELWRSDGTQEGTINVTSFNFLNIREITAVDGLVLFSAKDNTNDWELWRSDGTAIGTYVVKDINPTGSSIPQVLTNIGGTVYFVANDGLHGREPWKSDGTEAGTTLIKDINPTGDAFPTTPSTRFTEVGETIFFVASNGIDGMELWKTDGTTAGTIMLKDINPMGDSSVGDMVNVNGTLFFTARESDITSRRIWKSDGTEAGTVRITDINRSNYMGNPTVLNGFAYYLSDDGIHGDALWRSDCTEAGTALVKRMFAAWKISAFDRIILLSANDGPHGFELWMSDGTRAGTVLVADINPSGNSDPFYFTILEETFFFVADDGTHNDELWALDLHDVDDDTWSYSLDNCVTLANPAQSDVDGDGYGDACDECPAVPCNPCPNHPEEECTPEGSAGNECTAVDGCCVQTPDGLVEVCVEPGSMPEDSAITITQVPLGIDTEVVLGPFLERGELIATYILEPDGLTFDPPATLTMIQDVSDIHPDLHDELRIYQKDPDTGVFSSVPTTCDPVVEDPPGVFTATCTATLDHFSTYAMIAPFDTDGDGIPDEFGGVTDNCPDHPNPDQADCDTDGLGDVCAIAEGVSQDLNDNGIPDECEECIFNYDCDDGLVCTDKLCDDGTCVFIPNDAYCNDAVECTVDSCDQGWCVFVPDDAFCDDALFCNGSEVCDPDNDCQPGTPADCDDGVGCTDDSCNTGTDMCDNVPNDANCDNGLFCDGVETCHATLDCQAGDDPCLPTETCDEENDLCISAEPPLPEPGGPDCSEPIDCAGAWAGASCAGVVGEKGICYVPKNRYLSIDATVNDSAVAYQVELADSPDYPGAIGRTWWIDEPVCYDYPNGDPVLPAPPTCEGADRFGWVSGLVSAPVTRVWSEVSLHVADCGIVPNVVYEIRASGDGGGSFSDPLVINTAADPTGPSQSWGDITGGPVPDMPGLWLPPEGSTNMADVGNAIRTFENQTADTGFPPRVWVDVEINQVINLGDVQFLVGAFEGAAYAELADLEFIGVHPADCP